MTIEFHTYTVDEIEKDRASLLSVGEGELPLIPPVYWGLVKNNPDHPTGLPAAACLSINGERVAHIALAHRTIQSGADEFPCLWGYSYYTLPEKRSFGAGGLLIRELLAFLKGKGVAFAVLGSTEQANKVYEALGMQNAGRAPRYLLPLRTNPILRRYIPNATLASLSSALLNPVLRVWIAGLKLFLNSPAKNYRVIEQDQFQNCAFLSNFPDKDQTRLKRSEPLLNWMLKYTRSHEGFEVRAYSIINPANQPVGCFFISISTQKVLGRAKFRDVRICRVLDFVTTADTEAVPAAMKYLLEIAAQSGSDALEIITSNNELGDVCQKLRFAQMGGYDLLISRPEEFPAEIFDMNSWFLNIMESDTAD